MNMNESAFRIVLSLMLHWVSCYDGDDADGNGDYDDDDGYDDGCDDGGNDDDCDDDDCDDDDDDDDCDDGDDDDVLFTELPSSTELPYFIRKSVINTEVRIPVIKYGNMKIQTCVHVHCSYRS